MIPDGLVTLKEAARLLGVSRRRFYGWYQQGYIEHAGRMRAPGRPLLFRLEDVREFKDNGLFKPVESGSK